MQLLDKTVVKDVVEFINANYDQMDTHNLSITLKLINEDPQFR